MTSHERTIRDMMTSATSSIDSMISIGWTKEDAIARWMASRPSPGLLSVDAIAAGHYA
jgi:hypothetical protein